MKIDHAIKLEYRISKKRLESELPNRFAWQRTICRRQTLYGNKKLNVKLKYSKCSGAGVHSANLSDGSLFGRCIFSIGISGIVGSSH